VRASCSSDVTTRHPFDPTKRWVWEKYQVSRMVAWTTLFFPTSD